MEEKQNTMDINKVKSRKVWTRQDDEEEEQETLKDVIWNVFGKLEETHKEDEKGKVYLWPQK